MRRPIALDLSRLLIGARNRTLRGIEKIELGYAREFLSPGDTAVGVLPSVLGARAYDATRARAFVQALSAEWQETVTADDDAAFIRLRRLLAAAEPTRTATPGRTASAAHSVPGRYWRLACALRFSPGSAAASAVPERAIYLVAGHTLLAFPYFFRWLEKRRDVKPVFMMHDAIPFRFPEYVPASDIRWARRALETVSRFAAALIAPSEAAAAEVKQEIAKLGRHDIPIHVVRLPADEAFLRPAAAAPPPSRRPYFVAVGVLDPRKNHLLLLQVWRELVARDASAAPLLVLAGSRGWADSDAVSMLERSTAMHAGVIEAPGLSTPALRQVIVGARALLMPSFAEGFGLPVIEALSCGTPVIASDIPAHREAGGDHATYLSPIDGAGWLKEITARSRESDDALAARRRLAAAFQPQTWSSYFAELNPFLDSL